MTYIYTSKSNEEIRQLAQAIRDGKVFGSWMMKPGEDPSTVFVPMAFLPDAQLDEMKAQGVLHVYEFKANKGPIGAEGYPMFTSARFLSAIDCKRVDEKIAELNAKKGAKDG